MPLDYVNIPDDPEIMKKTILWFKNQWYLWS